MIYVYNIQEPVVKTHIYALHRVYFPWQNSQCTDYMTFLVTLSCLEYIYSNIPVRMHTPYFFMILFLEQYGFLYKLKRMYNTQHHVIDTVCHNLPQAIILKTLYENCQV